VRVAASGLLALVAANVGTMCAELAGVTAALELAGVTRYASVPVTALAVSVLVLRGGFKRVEHVRLALSAVLVARRLDALGRGAGPAPSATARSLGLLPRPDSTSGSPWRRPRRPNHTTRRAPSIPSLPALHEPPRPAREHASSAVPKAAPHICTNGCVHSSLWPYEPVRYRS
jgi:hypothetical protein